MTLVTDDQLREWFPNEPLSELTPRREAAEAYVRSRCRIDADTSPPGDIVEAIRLLINRYLARRNTADGTYGMSEFGVGRIATVDRDIQALIAPYRPVVFG